MAAIAALMKAKKIQILIGNPRTAPSVFYNTMAGAATSPKGGLSADAFHSYKAFEIEMFAIREIFGDTWQVGSTVVWLVSTPSSTLVHFDYPKTNVRKKDQ
jgi:hypothetical protein